MPYDLLFDLPYHLFCDMIFDLLCNILFDLLCNLSFDTIDMPTAFFVRSVHKFPSALPTPFFGRPCAIGLEKLPLPATPPYTTFMAYFRCTETCNRSEGIHRSLLAAPRVPYSGIVLHGATYKKESCWQDSPPAAGRDSDMLPSAAVR